MARGSGVTSLPAPSADAGGSARRCDIVFLPPSFPIVAMENPCLTFIIASILESSEFLLIDVIHEIAHGWFGNAVTNATWEEMWLSEGLATYAQRRITTEAYGSSSSGRRTAAAPVVLRTVCSSAGEAFTCLETAVRLDALHRQLRLLGNSNPVSKLQVKFEAGQAHSCLFYYLCEDFPSHCYTHTHTHLSSRRCPCGTPNTQVTVLVPQV